MSKFGKYDASGAVETEATECALTGRVLNAPYDTTVRYRVAGTPLFYRVLGSQAHRLTDEARQALDDEARATLPAPAVERVRALKAVTVESASEVKE